MPAAAYRAFPHRGEQARRTRVARPGTPAWNWPLTFFRDNFLSTLLEAGMITAEQRDAFLAAWEERGRDPGAYLFLPPMLDVIGVKP